MSWLSDHDLERAISKFADKETQYAFCGIYPVDTLPIISPQGPRIFIIMNIDTHNLPGKHWIALHIDKEHHGKVFDHSPYH